MQGNESRKLKAELNISMYEYSKILKTNESSLSVETVVYIEDS
jgi:hypothetical protein